MKDDFHSLPDGLPIPLDDGACDHLLHLKIPPIVLRSTAERDVCLATESKDRTVVYCYPRTGQPGREPLPEWDEIPGARGCTPQSCGFRDHYSEINVFGAKVFGLSTQTTGYQQEMVRRLRLPFEVLSDSQLAFANALHLPTFVFNSEVLLKRLTLIIRAGRIEKVFHPVFPPDRNAEEVVAWLGHNPL
ncbi:MAG: peroxiredoxin [Terriglobia bacterium]